MGWYEDNGLLLKAGDKVYRSGTPFVDLLYTGPVKWYEVQPGEEGRLDVVAWKCLDNPKRWREIALLNNVRDVLTEITVGRHLAYPVGTISKSDIKSWTYRE